MTEKNTKVNDGKSNDSFSVRIANHVYVIVRGPPERLISSLGALGKGVWRRRRVLYLFVCVCVCPGWVAGETPEARKKNN